MVRRATMMDERELLVYRGDFVISVSLLAAGLKQNTRE
jgi:hypothetical protein